MTGPKFRLVSIHPSPQTPLQGSPGPVYPRDRTRRVPWVPYRQWLVGAQSGCSTSNQNCRRHSITCTPFPGSAVRHRPRFAWLFAFSPGDGEIASKTSTRKTEEISTGSDEPVVVVPGTPPGVRCVGRSDAGGACDCDVLRSALGFHLTIHQESLMGALIVASCRSAALIRLQPLSYERVSVTAG